MTTSRAATFVAAAPLALCAAVACLTTVEALALLASQFRPVVIVPLGLIAAAAAALVVLRRMPAAETRTLLPNVLAFVGVLAFIGINIKYSAQEIWVFRDPSTYALTGEWLAHHSSAFVHTQPEVFGSVKGLTGGSLGFGQLHPGLVQSQYPDAAPMLVAIGGWFSDSLLLRVAPMIGGVALLGFYGLVRSIVTEWWALGAMALMAVSLPMINFSRAVYSEPVTMVFLLGGLALLFVCDEAGGWQLHLVTGLTIGAAELARVDGGLYLLAIAAYGVMRLARAVDRRTAVREVAAMAAGGVAVFLLGVVMTRHLSPLYWASHGHEGVELLAPAIGVAVVGVVVVALAWGPQDRRTKALALVPRIAWGCAGLILLLAVIGATRPFWLVSHHFVRADFTAAEEALQRAKHIKVDGTRDYAENSLTWIGWYYGVVVVVAGVLGAVGLLLRFARNGKPALIAFLMVFLFSAVLFLYYPNIAPDQIWVMRRYLPIVLPGFVLAAAFVGHRIGLRGRPAQGLAALLVVFSFFAVYQTTHPLVRVRQAVPELAEVENVCANLPAHAALLVTGELLDTYAMTARSYCRVPVAAYRVPTPQVLAQVAATAKASGRTLVLLADDPKTVPAGVHPISTLVVESWNTTLQQPAQASGHPVRSMFLFAVNADGTLTAPADQHFLTNTG